MNRIDEALRALDDRDWSNAEVVEEAASGSTSYTVSFSPEDTRALEVAASGRSLNPIELIRALVLAALNSVEPGQSGDQK